MSCVAIVITADAVRAAGAEPLILARDLRAPEAGEAFVRATLDRFGRIDALTCIAGAVPQRDMFEPTGEQWDDGAALKFHWARRLTIAAREALKISRFGRDHLGNLGPYARGIASGRRRRRCRDPGGGKTFADRGHQARPAGQQDPAGISSHGPATLHAPGL
jgi:NAD(P)-dependent dehydrogenase (short-subunit alcohol dehydrogenase family)